MRARIFLIVLIMSGIGTLHAEENVAPDFMQSIGKIYVVAGVCLVILVTLLVYLVILDRKISKLEKRQKNE
jgi:hypothetical protein